MKRFLLISSVMALSVLSLLAAPVQAQDPCGSISKVVADRELREIRADKSGFLFKVPKNYRAIASASGKTQYIRIFNPGTYEYLQCAEKNRLPLEGFLQTLLVTSIPTNGKYTTIEAFLSDQPMKTNVLKTLNVAGQTALFGLHEGFGTTAMVAVLTPDKRFVIEIEADYNGSSTDGYDPGKVAALPDLITVVDNLKFGTQASVAPQTQQTTASTTQVAPTLRPLVPQIQTSLPRGLAMRLPTAIEGVAYDGRKFPIYGKILPRDSDQFTIQMVQTPDCEVRVCQVGYLAVAPRGSRSLPTSDRKAESVNITSTIRGKYINQSFPGSASSPPVNLVVWEQDGFAYIVSSFMNKQKVLEIAKSMANGVVIQSRR